MPTLVKLRNRAQITLPKETVKTLNLKEGKIFPLSLAMDKVVINPVAIIPEDELWA